MQRCIDPCGKGSRLSHHTSLLAVAQATMHFVRTFVHRLGKLCVLNCERGHRVKGPARLCMQMQGEVSSPRPVAQRIGIGRRGTPPISFPAWFLDPKLPPAASSTSEQRAKDSGRQLPLVDDFTPGSQCTTSGATSSWNRTSSPAASTPARSRTPNAHSHPRASHSRTASDRQKPGVRTACTSARGRAVPYSHAYMLLEERMPSLNAHLATSTTWNSVVVRLPAARLSGRAISMLYRRKCRRFDRMMNRMGWFRCVCWQVETLR